MTLSVATSGFLPSLTPECIATQGFICGAAVTPDIELPSGGGAGTDHYKRKDLIEEENAIIMAVIKAFLEKEG